MTHGVSQIPEARDQPEGVATGCLLVGGLFLLGVVAVIALLAFQARGDGRVDLGLPGDYVPGTPVYYASDHLFAVRLEDGSVLALSDIDPHNPPGRRSCRVTFRPDLGENEEPGRFFDACTGAMYDIEGQALGNDGLDLARLEIELDDERMRVRPGE